MSSGSVDLGAVKQCPLCGCMLDVEGKTFSARFEMDGTAYYCNNPICHGRDRE